MIKNLFDTEFVYGALVGTALAGPATYLLTRPDMTPTEPLAESLSVEAPHYNCTDARKVRLHGRTAWDAAAEHTVGRHHNLSLKEKALVARELRQGGSIYECTLEHAVATGNTELADRIRGSDTLYVTREGTVRGYIDGAKKDGIMLDRVSEIYVPRL